MFSNIKIWIEDHPYLTGTLILGIILLWFIFRSRSTAAASQTGTTAYGGQSEALQAAELSAGVQTQSAYLSAQSQIAGYNASVSAQQIQSAAAVAASQVSAGVQNVQTAAQLQLGLAGLGFTPSTSPFGLTVPIAGVSPVLPGGTIPPVQPVTTVNPSVPTPAPAVVSQLVIPGVANVPSITQSEFAGETIDTTHAGTGGLVTVPSVPIYGPVDGSGNVSFLGYTSQSTIPSSSGLTWSQYYGLVTANEPPMNETPGGVTAETAANIAAQLDYLNNPNSCHNRVCA